MLFRYLDLETIYINIYKKTLKTCHEAEGTVVIIDVLRAFTTAAYAFDRGAEQIFLVSTVEEAFELRHQYPDLLLAGEVNGYPIEGFDLPNSPSAIADLDLSKRRLVLRTTTGSQGAVLVTDAKDIYVASLAVATATACSINELGAENVTFVEAGVKTKGGGEEDIACADYIASLLLKAPLATADVQNRVLNSGAATKFSEPGAGDFPASDLEHALKIDRFNFAMKASRIDNRLVLEATDRI